MRYAIVALLAACSPAGDGAATSASVASGRASAPTSAPSAVRAPAPSASSARPGLEHFPPVVAHCYLAPEAKYDPPSCFEYFDGDAADWARLCDALHGKSAAGEACSDVNRLGSCTLPDGSIRVAYAPMLDEEARAGCARAHGEFMGGDVEATNLFRPPVQQFVCAAYARGECLETRVSLAREITAETQDCRELEEGTWSKGGHCEAKDLVATCLSLIPGRKSFYYAPKHTLKSAKDACVGVLSPAGK